MSVLVLLSTVAFPHADMLYKVVFILVTSEGAAIQLNFLLYCMCFKMVDGFSIV